MFTTVYNYLQINIPTLLQAVLPSTLHSDPLYDFSLLEYLHVQTTTLSHVFTAGVQPLRRSGAILKHIVVVLQSSSWLGHYTYQYS